MRLRALALLLLSCATASRGAAHGVDEAPTQLPGVKREVRLLDVTYADGHAGALEVAITRPDDDARHPVVLLSHGSPRDDNRREMTPTAPGAPALWFAERGYAAVAVMRRGYGRTVGETADGPGPCTNRRYLRAVRISVEDLRAALDAVGKMGWADASRVVLVGISAGGIASVGAGAENLPGVRAVVSFAGGRGSDAPDHVCQADRLIDTFRALGQTSKVPNLWLYAANDHFFGPELAAQFAAAYREHDAPLDFVALPEWGSDGHHFYGEAPIEKWWPAVKDFLDKLDLPTAVVTPVTLPKIPAPQLSDEGLRGFAKYLEARRFEKAFATNGKAWAWAWGRRTRGDAIAQALRECGEHGRTGCRIYAVGNALAE